MDKMIPVFSIKQEPELVIISENDDDIANINYIQHYHQKYSGKLDRQIVDSCQSLDFKSETPFDSLNAISVCDNTQVRCFRCNICSKTYTTKQMLKLHIHSIHLLLKPFQCEICSRSFADKYTLTTHFRIHSGERPYTCPMCSKTFVQHSALTKHKRIHTKEKPYQCGICSKAFRDRSSLIPHRKIHTGEVNWNRKFKCEICNSSFVKNSHLVRHNKTKSHQKEVKKSGIVSNIKLIE